MRLIKKIERDCDEIMEDMKKKEEIIDKTSC